MSREPAPQSDASEPVVEDGVVAGNYENKYASRNPIAALLVRRFVDTLLELADRTGAADVHEVGCGEGELCRRLARPGRAVRGSDFSGQIIERARALTAEAGLDVSYSVRSVHELGPDDAAELVACCEVLEHVEQPEQALERLAGLARPWLLLSVPREPTWRVLNMARGAYWSDWGNTPGHRNHWSKRGFVRMVARHLDVVTVRSPLPWTVVLCRSRPT